MIRMNTDRIDYKKICEFYRDKKVFITGNTGFKGSWLTKILLHSGAKVVGYALEPNDEQSLFVLSGLEHNDRLHQFYSDIRDLKKMKSAINTEKPDVVFHLAAQPIVREAYKEPVLTYSTNVMGTVNICEAVRGLDSFCSFINVTTDKVYRNNEWEWGYRETDYLDGQDPYSNSKSCSELVTHSYKDSFFNDDYIRVSTVRAGNVIGGGDFSKDRIIPDCIRTVENSIRDDQKMASICVRNPYSIRPYEHVLEPLFAYMMIAARQFEEKRFAGCYNVGPDDTDCLTTGDLVTLFCEKWNNIDSRVKATWIDNRDENAPHEAQFLKLDCSKIKTTFGWRTKWSIDKAIEKVIQFSKVWLDGDNVEQEMEREIMEYIGE